MYLMQGIYCVTIILNTITIPNVLKTEKYKDP
jgi:hypothetical protein